MTDKAPDPLRLHQRRGITMAATGCHISHYYSIRFCVASSLAIEQRPTGKAGLENDGHENQEP